MTRRVPADTEALRRRVGGRDDAGWDRARRAWNAAADQRPAAVVFPPGAEDVAATLAHAGERGLRVVPQATGHGATPLGALDDAILRTGGLRDATVDAPAATAARLLSVNRRR